MDLKLKSGDFIIEKVRGKEFYYVILLSNNRGLVVYSISDEAVFDSSLDTFPIHYQVYRQGQLIYEK